jgi:hypothetical protein
MPHMLPVSAVEIGNPLAKLIQMKPDNRLLCHRCRQS